MNKYVLRTSVLWLCVLTLVIAFFVYRQYPSRKEIHVNNSRQPVAAGPMPTTQNMPTQPTGTTEPPLAPVQLTPEGMQSIGVKTGVVEQKQISDDIRASGTVDIDERLISYVQIRFR